MEKLQIQVSLDSCAEEYRKFCKKYKPQPKPEKRNTWGSKKLANLKHKKKSNKTSPRQKSLWEEWSEPTEEIRRVAENLY